MKEQESKPKNRLKRLLCRSFSDDEWERLKGSRTFARAIENADDTLDDFERLCSVGNAIISRQQSRQVGARRK